MFPYEKYEGRIPGWVLVLGVGVVVAIYIAHEERKERRPGGLSGSGCRDKEGKFVPVPQCRRRRTAK